MPDHRSKRQKLEDLAKHPRTPPHEAAAAQRAIDAMGPDTDTPFTGLRDYLSSDAFNQRTAEAQPGPSKFWQSEALATVLHDLDEILRGKQATPPKQPGWVPGGRQTGPTDASSFGPNSQTYNVPFNWAEFLRNMRQEAAEAAAAAADNPRGSFNATFCPACDHGVAAHTSYGCSSCALMRRGCHARFSDLYGDWEFPKKP